MKLTAIILLSACLTTSAKGHSQRVTLSLQNASMETVFQEIRKQTGYDFLYGSKMLQVAKPVSINVKNASLEQVLEKCFKDQPLTYNLVDRTIIVKPKTTDPNINPGDINELPPPIDIKGKVTNDKGEPLGGATIIEKGTKNATTTKEDGTFVIDVANTRAVLIITFIEYETKEITVSNQTNIQVTLTLVNANLSDVILVGYGKVKQSDLTGSVSSVKFSETPGSSIASLQQGLQGRASGVQISQTSGALDGKFSVTIRGVGSINSTSEPLYVVDGVPLFSGALSTINPDDIESVNILKDASSSAIYGSRAANGVVLVKTKRGKVNSSKIVFNTELGFEKVTRLLKMLSSEEQRQLTYDAFVNSGLPTSGYDDPNDPLWKIDNNWQELMTRTAARKKYSLGIYGGSEKTQFSASGSMLNRDGVIDNTEFKSGSLRLSLDHKFSDRFSLSSSLSGSHQRQKVDNREDFFSGVIRDAVFAHSHVPNTDQNGNFTAAPTSGAPYWGANSNPLAALLENDRRINDTRLLGNVKLDYILAKGLTLAGSFGADILTTNGRTFLPKYKRGITERAVGDLTLTNSIEINWITDATLQYDIKFKDRHAFTGLIGGAVQQFQRQFSSNNGTGTTNNLLNQLSNQTAFSGTSLDVTSGLVSSFMRINYAYNNRYLFTGTVRRDGSSKFIGDNKYGVFPSGAFAWKLSNERFFKSGLVSDLKLRVSYGLTGNQNINDFEYLTKVGTANYVLENSLVLGNSALNIGNPDLRWESNKQFDFGTDIQFLNGRLSVIMDYYDKRSDGLLLQVPLPRTAGIAQPYTVNLGSIQNRGIEFAISSKNTVGKFKWTTNFNISFNRNKVLDIGKNALGEPFQIPGQPNFFSGITNLTEAGRPIGAFYLYVWEGIWQLNEKDQANAFSGAIPGDPKFKDVNGDGQFTNADRTFIDAQPNPAFFGGITNDFEYKNWFFSFFINGSGGNKLINSTKFLNGGAFPFLQNLAEVKDRWTPNNPSNTVPQANQIGNTTTLVTRLSTNHLQDASFLRLKNVSLSYNLPKSALRRYKIDGIILMLSATNLLTLTKYEGFDPEAASIGNQLSAGIDYAPYPLSRIYTATFQLTF